MFSITKLFGYPNKTYRRVKFSFISKNASTLGLTNGEFWLFTQGYTEAIEGGMPTASVQYLYEFAYKHIAT